MSNQNTKRDFQPRYRQGQEVKIVSPHFTNRFGTIEKYEHKMQSYLVVMEDGDTVLSFAPNELEMA